MLLAIDIGNTNISLGIIKGTRVLRRSMIKTPRKGVKACLELSKMLKEIKEKYPVIKRSILCSVVPYASQIVQGIVEKKLGVKSYIVGKDIKVPINNNYRKPQQVGQDRLVGAYAAKYFYGAPVLIIDFGTAITFDVVSSKGAYEGGMIIPGIRLSAESLFQKTSLLPPIHIIKMPRDLIGKDTEESILSGIFWGYGTMTAGLIDLIQKKYRTRMKVIVTGGHTRLIKKFISKKINYVDRDLVFQGMRLLVELI